MCFHGVDIFYRGRGSILIIFLLVTCHTMAEKKVFYEWGLILASLKCVELNKSFCCWAGTTHKYATYAVSLPILLSMVPFCDVFVFINKTMKKALVKQLAMYCFSCCNWICKKRWNKRKTNLVLLYYSAICCHPRKLASYTFTALTDKLCYFVNLNCIHVLSINRHAPIGMERVH